MNKPSLSLSSSGCPSHRTLPGSPLPNPPASERKPPLPCYSLPATEHLFPGLGFSSAAGSRGSGVTCSTSRPLRTPNAGSAIPALSRTTRGAAGRSLRQRPPSPTLPTARPSGRQAQRGIYMPRSCVRTPTCHPTADTVCQFGFVGSPP